METIFSIIFENHLRLNYIYIKSIENDYIPIKCIGAFLKITCLKTKMLMLIY